MNSPERRLHPRIEQRLKINVGANGYDFVTDTHNISCLGAYCTIDKYVPPFTKISIKLNLPVKQNGVRKNYNVNCHGVIVRTEDEPNGKFNIAIFFDKIQDQSRQNIVKYIKQFIS
jgi:PilZ domain